MDPARGGEAGLLRNLVAAAISERQAAIGTQSRPCGATEDAGMSAAPSGTNSAALHGKHALVTGGARGIGLAISRMLLADGVRVTMLGRNAKKLEESARGLKSLGEVGCVTADVASAAAVTEAFAQACVKFGPINILINNAGEAASAPFLKTDAKLWRQMMSVN